MNRRSAALVIAAVVMASCSPSPVATSSNGHSPETPTPAITPVLDGTPVPSDAGPTGSLVVSQSSVAQLPGVYTEGAVAFVEVYDAGGALAASATNGDYLDAVELLRTDLPPGRYELRSFVRPCSGACPATDPPADECRVELEIEPATAVAAQIVRSVGVPCRAMILPQ